jgi:hypothetical protein
MITISAKIHREAPPAVPNELIALRMSQGKPVPEIAVGPLVGKSPGTLWPDAVDTSTLEQHSDISKESAKSNDPFRRWGGQARRQFIGQGTGDRLGQRHAVHPAFLTMRSEGRARLS